ncbi:MAG: TIM barrel protein [Planctomycetaceae bacterium]|nr:TIM barrel protein [Planctomycetaceae bacterium]
MILPISRRRLLKGISLLPFLAGGVNAFGQGTPSPVKGNIRQATCYGPFRSMPLDVLAPQLLEMGILGLDLVNPEEWESVQKTGLLVTLSRAPDPKEKVGMGNGFNHVEYHDELLELYSDLIPRAGQAGVRQIICFSGNRKGKSDDEGIQNCITGLKRVMPIAEKHGVTLVMELLNPFGHKDYHADRTEFGAQIARGVGSENFKLLYDIYHMQLSEGNLIDTIRKNKDVIGHYHTAGAPGRKDLDEEQEIFYPAVMRAIVATGFKGFVAHEFTPKSQDKLTSLREAVRICDV